MSEQKTAKKGWVPDSGSPEPGRKKGRFNPIDFGYECWRTLCRHRLDNTGLTKSQVMFTNFFLHIQPVKVHRRTLMFKTTAGLGLISLYLFLILAATGVLIMFHYVPSVTPGPDGLPDAYQRMLNLRSNVFWGVFIRNLHRWAAHAMVVAVFLHMLRVFFTGAYKAPRQFNWVVGSVLALLTIFMSYTGYLLPWDQLAYWGVKVGTEIARIAPGGALIRSILLGDTEVGGEALLRFYVLHVAVLPIVLGIGIGIHLWRVRKDGGLARPADTANEKLIPLEECGYAKNNSVYNEARSYQLVEVVKGVEPKVDEEVEQMVFTWPKLVVREVIVFALTLGIVSAAALLVDAPLEGPADPALPTNPAKAPWYFLGLQELVSYHAFIGGVVIPGLLVHLMIAYPYLEMFIERFLGLKDRGGVGVWFAKERWLENLIVLSLFASMAVLIIIGTFFRGANWEFVYPWQLGAPGGH
jgi:quinol-cytochrome oxidoreductase complex cytochrome b subunit